MDQGKVLLVNVSKGQMGEDSTHLLGAFVLSTLSLAALSRAETTERRPYFIYADEFQAFTTPMIATDANDRHDASRTSQIRRRADARAPVLGSA